MSKRVTAGLALAAAVVLVRPAAAAEWAAVSEGTLSPHYASCVVEAGGVDAAMLACVTDEFERQGVRLDAAMDAALASFGPEAMAARAALEQAEIAWINYRARTCAFASALAAPGTRGVVAQFECMVELTAERAAWLLANVVDRNAAAP